MRKLWSNIATDQPTTSRERTAIVSRGAKTDHISSSVALGPVSVPPLLHDGLPLVIVWPVNPYPGDVSDKLVTFTLVTYSGVVVHMDNLSPPLAFIIPEPERISVDPGTIWTRTCVFWDSSSRSWETDGVTTVRTNYTDVVYESVHATSFSVALSKCASPRLLRVGTGCVDLVGAVRRPARVRALRLARMGRLQGLETSWEQPRFLLFATSQGEAFIPSAVPCAILAGQKEEEERPDLCALTHGSEGL